MHEVFQSLAELPPAVLPYLLAAGALAILIAAGGILQRMSLWLRGRDDPTGALFPLGAARIVWLSLTRFFAPDCFFARRVFATSRLRGIMVTAIVWSTVLLALGVGVSAVTFVSSIELDEMLDRGLALAMDLAGGVLAIGLLVALGRRFLFRPKRYIPLAGDAVIMSCFFVTILSGLMLESTHVAEQLARSRGPMALAALPPYSPLPHDPEGTEWYWQPFGWLIAQLGLALGMDAETFERGRLAVYLFHAASAFVLIAYLPFSKLFHLFAAQITTFARSQRPARAAYQIGRASC